MSLFLYVLLQCCDTLFCLWKTGILKKIGKIQRNTEFLCLHSKFMALGWMGAMLLKKTKGNFLNKTEKIQGI